MKKYTQTLKYRRHQLSSMRRYENITVKRKGKIYIPKNSLIKSKSFDAIPDYIEAPQNFCFISHYKGCLSFVRELRSRSLIGSAPARRVFISLAKIESVDYGAISLLKAVSSDLRSKGISLHGNLPSKTACKQFFIDSGFLNDMTDLNHRKFNKSNRADTLFFEKGSGKFSYADNLKTGEAVKNAVKHLTGSPSHFKPLRSILLEICGNAIEHSGTVKKQWLLGVKYESDKVIFTVTDVGKGILETLFRKYKTQVTEFFTSSRLDILQEAFNQKYGSRTKEINRNKGLPAVKSCFENGYIKNLVVITNNVILCFDEKNKSEVFGRKCPRFKGTFYQWEIDKDCLENNNLNYAIA